MNILIILYLFKYNFLNNINYIILYYLLVKNYINKIIITLLYIQQRFK